MTKEKTQYEKSRRELLDSPGFNPTIEGDEKTIDTILKEDDEFLSLLTKRIRDGEASIRIIRNEKMNTCKLEILKTDDNKLLYFTDIPVDILMIEKRIIASGLIPEYITD
ncbi:MAG: hypothetical protein Q7S43_00010 [bacterium]|nr:hypothetical protein [bacterium]